MNNKNILELCLSPELGGLELYVASCYKYFSKKTICSIALAPNQKLDKYLENTDKFYLTRNKLFPLIPALKLSKYIDNNDIDIVHFHWTRDMITVVLAKALSRKKPKLIQSRHMGMTRFKDDFYHRWMYKNIDTMHAVTHKVKGQIEKFIPSTIRPNVTTIYPGTKMVKIDKTILEDLRAKYKNNDEFIVGIVGRIEKVKGQYKLIEAIAELDALNIKLLIVGSEMEISYLNELKQKVKELNVKNKVVFTGFTRNVHEYMQFFDVNILATENETFGLVVIESMVNKVPVIATNNGGPLEIINDGVDGMFFDGTSKDLSNKIYYLYQNNEFRDKIALAGYNKVKKNFDSAIQLNKLYRIIN